ncbi:ABC transporter substrate-binding protein [Marinomonas ushuaiensis DSM 15871]|uniref:ABC transporter substrate-binding protein n=1 Tax=Marinomonas ushuaiensis DSM 15871 TaxID=1122207 RepID=X7E4G6_9GAMM|nr:MetQ/NlpA family ABC transporter substrate-binding protein [Marinomonas ushuaiensis]ETX10073.1 ABC transporter substrate-binding protein [Marinomonas ushuaiensis DSM 15871]
MKKILLLITSVLFTFTLTACQSKDDNTIKIGVSYYPFYSADSTKPDLLDIIKANVEENGFNLEKVVFLNYAEANPALANGELDGNLIQHELYMDIFNQRSGATLELVQPVYHATFALYSSIYASVEDITDGETVYLPNDGVNTARALLLLQSAGLIELKNGVNFQAGIADIISNPKQLKFIETPLTATAGAYDESGRDLAVMYPTFARSLSLSGNDERIYLEERNAVSDAYAISFATRTDNANDEKTKVLAEALTSDAVRKYLEENYAWASTPAF